MIEVKPHLKHHSKKNETISKFDVDYKRKNSVKNIKKAKSSKSTLYIECLAMKMFRLSLIIKGKKLKFKKESIQANKKATTPTILRAQLVKLWKSRH